MKKNLKKVVLVLALLLPGVIKAQEFNVTAKADFVSDYIWRGAYQNSGFSVQPTLGLSYGNLSLSAWGSQSLTKTDGAQEFDINLSYTIGGLGITVTDYWWNGITMPYGDYKHDHHFEGTLAYNFGENFPLTLSWSTMFAGGDDNKDGDRAYSTYINASYNIACPAEITLTPSVGFTPWKGMYDADGAAFTDIACNHSIFRHDNFIGCFSADKIKMPARKYFCFNIPVYKNMVEESSCRSPYHEEYIRTGASGNPEGLCH